MENLIVMRSKKTVFWLLTCLFVSGYTTSTGSFALDGKYDQQFYSNNNILFYNPNGQQNCSQGVVSVSLSGGTNLEKIYNYMVSKGLSPTQAAAVVGNISIESGGYPTRIQGKPPDQGSQKPEAAGSAGWGLIQWTPGTNIYSDAKAGNAQGEVSSLEYQFDAVWGRMQTRHADFLQKFKTINDIAEATTYFEVQIEAAGKPNMPDRIAAAQLALRNYGNTSSTTSVASTSSDVPSNCDTPNGAVSGNIVQTAVNYAWPEYHAPNYFNLKPSYAQAVANAQQKGKYVGGGPHPGVDCGGFVTRVMQDSGADPNYGGGGATQVQYNYLVSHSNLYQEIHPKNTSDLAPGDIAINPSEHTYLYIGKQSGFETTIASASYSPSNTAWRSPMAGKEAPADPSYHWFRFKGGTQNGS